MNDVPSGSAVEGAFSFHEGFQRPRFFAGANSIAHFVERLVQLAAPAVIDDAAALAYSECFFSCLGLGHSDKNLKLRTQSAK